MNFPSSGVVTSNSSFIIPYKADFFIFFSYFTISILFTIISVFVTVLYACRIIMSFSYQSSEHIASGVELAAEFNPPSFLAYSDARMTRSNKNDQFYRLIFARSYEIILSRCTHLFSND